MRILLDYRPALRQRTGVGEFVHELARALALSTAGCDLTLFSASWKDRVAAEVSHEMPGVVIADRRLPLRALTWSWNRLEWPPVEWLAGPADVVHSQTPLLIPSSRAAQVATIHDLHFLSHPERSEAEMRRDFPVLVERHARRADHIVVSSGYAAREVATRLGVPRAKITVCSPGVPRWSAEVARERRGGEAGSTILFVGTLDARKNLDGLLEAYAALRGRCADPPPLVLAGGVRHGGRKALQRIQTAPLAGHVRLLGYVSDQSRRRLYRDARMLVLPSFEEGFGLPVLEAMACGVPVVVSDRGALPEVAGPAASPINPDDTDALSTAMERLLDDDAAREASERGLAQASRYSWDACARAAGEAYRAAVTTRAGRHA